MLTTTPAKPVTRSALTPSCTPASRFVSIGRVSDTAPQTPVGRHLSLPFDVAHESAPFHYVPPIGLPASAADTLNVASREDCSLDITSTLHMMERGELVRQWKPVGDIRSEELKSSAATNVRLFYHGTEFDEQSGAVVHSSTGALYWNSWSEEVAPKQLQSKHCIRLSEISEIMIGKDSQVFRCASASGAVEEHCCTLITDRVAVDLEFVSSVHCCAWLFGICSIVTRSGKALDPVPNDSTHAIPTPNRAKRKTRRFSIVCRNSSLFRHIQEDTREGDVYSAVELANPAKLGSFLQPQFQLLKKEYLDLKQSVSGILDKLKQEMQFDTEQTLRVFESKYNALHVTLCEERRHRIQACDRIIELQGNIRVFCRIRPLNNQEMVTGDAVSTMAATSTLVNFTQPGQIKDFSFDRVFGSQSTQDEVYNEVKPFVQSAVDGFPVCVFAYGQTGSGKTYTMQGTSDQPGVSLRAIDDIFALTGADRDIGSTYTPAQVAVQVGVRTQQLQKPNKWFYSIFVSALEIYNEQICDLLTDCNKAARASAKSLEIKHGPEGVYVSNLQSAHIGSINELHSLIRNRVEVNRRTASTAMNEHSSRSHSVLIVNIQGHNPFTDEWSHGRLLLIDLAGSERISRSGVTGIGLKEASSINASLSALGTCLAALQNKASHIPYRNSKLTHLLSDCLGGSAKAIMLCQLAPSAESSAETLCSLQFASRARSVELGAAKKMQPNAGREEQKLRQQLKNERDEKDRLLNEAQQRQKVLEEQLKHLRQIVDNDLVRPDSLIVGKNKEAACGISSAFDFSTKRRIHELVPNPMSVNENTPITNVYVQMPLNTFQTKKRKTGISSQNDSSSHIPHTQPFSSSLASLVRSQPLVNVALPTNRRLEKRRVQVPTTQPGSSTPSMKSKSVKRKHVPVQSIWSNSTSVASPSYQQQHQAHMSPKSVIVSLLDLNGQSMTDNSTGQSVPFGDPTAILEAARKRLFDRKQKVIKAKSTISATDRSP